MNRKCAAKDKKKKKKNKQRRHQYIETEGFLFILFVEHTVSSSQRINNILSFFDLIMCETKKKEKKSNDDLVHS